MALGLHAECKKRLVESIYEQLRSVVVRKNCLLDVGSTMGLMKCEKVLPNTERFRSKFKDFISENPIYDFVVETLSRDLLETRGYDPDRASTTLKALEGYSDLKAAATGLVDQFDSLPWQFRVSCPLSWSLSKVLRKYWPEYTLSDQMRIITPGSEYNQILPLVSGIKARDSAVELSFPVVSSSKSLTSLSSMFDRAKPAWELLATSFLQVDVEGFIGEYEWTTPIYNALASLKAFCGLSLAIDFLQRERVAPMISSDMYSDVSLAHFLGKNQILIHKYGTDGWVVWGTMEVPEDLAQTLEKFSVNTDGGSISDLQGWVTNCLATLSSVFRNTVTGAKLSTAGEWFFDSSVGKNELLSYVQLAVVMEILLGEKSRSDLVGIGELLSNRCAYLIGKTHDERSQILGDFNRIYDVRSSIVHRGKSRLTRDEQFLFFKLQRLCRRVIAAEMDLLIKGAPKRE
jgi:hypothetical protein